MSWLDQYDATEREIKRLDAEMARVQDEFGKATTRSQMVAAERRFNALAKQQQRLQQQLGA